MLSFRKRTGIVLSTLLLSTTAFAAPALAAGDADPFDQWLRWGGSPREATVRSLDFIGPLLFAGSESDGVFSSPTAIGPWSQQNGGLDSTAAADDVRQVKVAPNGLVYAATSAGLFRSPAGQGGWTQVGGGVGSRKLNMGGIQSVMFNGPTGTDITVAVAGAGGAGVYYSSDNGEHWDRASGMSDPEAVYHLTSGPLQVPMYAAADNGVYASVDFGRSWILTSDGIPPGETTLRVAVSPTNPKDLYASTSGGVYRSGTAGVTWEDASGKDGQHLPPGGKRAFLLTSDLSGKFGPARALVGTDQGVYATIDNGDHWKPMSGKTLLPDSSLPMRDRIVWSLGLGFTTPVIMAGTSGFGVFNVGIKPIGGGAPVITPTSGLKAGTELKVSNLDETNNNLDERKYLGFTGTKPYFFDYQWRKCDAAGANCIDLAGAKGTSYVIPEADENTTARYALKVTARNIVSPQPLAVTSPLTTGGVAALPDSEPTPKSGAAPTWTQSPAGQPYWDSTFTISPGTWKKANDATNTTIAATFKYKWERCLNATCTVLPSATAASYKVQTGDIGYFLRAYVSGTFAGISSDWRLVNSSSTILNKFPVNTDPPSIVGEAYLGRTLGSTAGGWSGFNMTYERRWLRCEADGLGCNPMAFPTQTGSTYAVVAADMGKRLKLEVKAIAKDPNQNRVTTVFSGLTPVITDPPPPVVDPVPAGEVPVGQPGAGQEQPQANQPPQQQQPQLVTVKVPTKLKTGAKLEVPKSVAGFKKLKYQWLRNGKKIKKATKRTYKLAKADRGKKISCKVTLTPAAGGKATTFTTLPVLVPKK